MRSKREQKTAKATPAYYVWECPYCGHEESEEDTQVQDKIKCGKCKHTYQLELGN